MVRDRVCIHINASTIAARIVLDGHLCGGIGLADDDIDVLRFDVIVIAGNVGRVCA